MSDKEQSLESKIEVILRCVAHKGMTVRAAKDEIMKDVEAALGDVLSHLRLEVVTLDSIVDRGVEH